MSTTVVPMTDHIVLKAVESEEISSFGLVIPDSAKEKPQHGHVVAVGPGKRNEKGELDKIDLSAGDRVLYKKYTGQEITVGTEEYIIIEFKDVLAKLEEAAKPAAKKAAARK